MEPAPGFFSTWRQGESNASDVFYSAGRDAAGGGTEWSTPQNLTNDAVFDKAPDFVITLSGTALAAYQKMDFEIEDDPDLYFQPIEIDSTLLNWNRWHPPIIKYLPRA